MWGPTGHTPASCRPCPSSNEMGESAAHVTSKSTRRGKLRNDKLALLAGCPQKGGAGDVAGMGGMGGMGG